MWWNLVDQLASVEGIDRRCFGLGTFYCFNFLHFKNMHLNITFFIPGYVKANRKFVAQ